MSLLFYFSDASEFAFLHIVVFFAKIRKESKAICASASLKRRGRISFAACMSFGREEAACYVCEAET